jgi:hypothetical protein
MVIYIKKEFKKKEGEKKKEKMSKQIISIYSSKNSDLIGSLIFYMNPDKSTLEINITNLWIIEEYRYRGYGKRLLKEFFSKLSKYVDNHSNILIISIELDDMTDKAHKGSIYEKFGFEYIQEVYPEMILRKTRNEFMYFVEKKIQIIV